MTRKERKRILIKIKKKEKNIRSISSSFFCSIN